MTTVQAPKASKTQHHPALPAATVKASRDADRPTSPVHKTRTSTVRAVTIEAICVGTAAAIYSQRSTIGEGFHKARDLDWVWVAAASLVEVLSMLALALLYRALLRLQLATSTLARALLWGLVFWWADRI